MNITAAVPSPLTSDLLSALSTATNNLFCDYQIDSLQKIAPEKEIKAKEIAFTEVLQQIAAFQVAATLNSFVDNSLKSSLSITYFRILFF